MPSLRLVAFVCPLLVALACNEATSPRSADTNAGVQLAPAGLAHAAGGSWETKAPLNIARNAAASGVIGGKLYVVSGSNLTALEVYDPTSNIWSGAAPIPTNRAYAGAGAIDGRLYVVGGCVNSDCRIGVTNRLEMYNPLTNSWQTRAGMPTARAAMATGVIGGKLYVVGGFQFCSGACPIYNTLEVYDPLSNTWATKAPMPTARTQMGGAVISGKLYVVGGTTNGTVPGQLATLEVYDPTTDTWTTNASMPTPRFALGSGVVDGIMYAVGGYNGASLSVVEAYDAASDTWTTVASIPTVRNDPQPQGINGVLYVAGNGVGASTTVEAFTPDAVVYPPLVIPPTSAQVRAGGFHTCGLRASSTVVCWGENLFGQSTPPPGLNAVVQLSTGGTHTCALKADGTATCWGENGFGQGSVPAGFPSLAQVSAGGSQTCVLRTDRIAACWGNNESGKSVVPAGLGPLAQVSAGSHHSCALRANGRVACWGQNGAGQLNVPAELTDVVQISAGNFHSCALKTDATVVCWGGQASQNFGQAAVPPGLTSVTEVSSGDYQTCVRKSDSTVQCWGRINVLGLMPVPSGLASVTQVSSGYFHNCALKADGTVVCWGSNFDPFRPPAFMGQSTVPAGLNLIFDAQTIAFTSVAPILPLIGASYPVTAAASSGLAVSITSLTRATCSMAGGIATFISAGECTIAANQAGNASYLAAPEQRQSITVISASQATTNLIGALAGLGLPAGVENSLSAPLSNLNTDNLTAACGKLNAFIAQVSAKLQNGQLAATAATQLTGAANAIRASLGCG